MLQCVGVYWSVLGVCLECVAGCCSVLKCVGVWRSVLQRLAVCLSVLQCVVVWCSVSIPSTRVRVSASSLRVCVCALYGCVSSLLLQCVAVCCSVLQCVVEC